MMVMVVVVVVTMVAAHCGSCTVGGCGEPAGGIRLICHHARFFV